MPACIRFPAGATRAWLPGNSCGVRWPKYWTGFDVAANVAGYVPLGFLLALSFLRRGSQRFAPSHTGGCGHRGRARGRRVVAVHGGPAKLPALARRLERGLRPQRRGCAGRRGAGGGAGAGRRDRPLEPLSRALVRRGCARRAGAAGAVAVRAAVSGLGAVRAGPGFRAGRNGAHRLAARHALPGVAAGARCRIAAAGAGHRTGLRRAGRPHSLPAGLLDHPLAGPARLVRRSPPWPSAWRRPPCRRR